MNKLLIKRYIKNKVQFEPIWANFLKGHMNYHDNKIVWNDNWVICSQFNENIVDDHQYAKLEEDLNAGYLIFKNNSDFAEFVLKFS